MTVNLRVMVHPSDCVSKWLQMTHFLLRACFSWNLKTVCNFGLSLSAGSDGKKCCPGKWLVTPVEITSKVNIVWYSAPPNPNENSSLEKTEEDMRLIFSSCVTFKLVMLVLFEPPSSADTHRCQPSLWCTFVCWSGCFLKQHKLEVKFTVTELLKQSEGTYKHLQFPSAAAVSVTTTRCHRSWQQNWQNQKLTARF